MSFLETFDSLASQPDQQRATFLQWLTTRPADLFAELRTGRPILSMPGLAVVTRYADVVDVLHRDKEFSVRHYNPKMERATGAFFLGMEDGATYEREASIMRLACPRTDLERIAAFISHYAVEAVQTQRSKGRLDLVEHAFRSVPGQLVADYFGVPGPDKATLLRWLRSIFHDLFLNAGDRDTAVRDAALQAAQELNAFMDDQIGRIADDILAGRAEPDTVLARTVKMQSLPATHMDNVGIRRNVAGLIIGTVDTTSKAATLAFDYLLAQPELLARAVALAQGEDMDALAAFLWEAMRFNPQATAITRIAIAEATIAAGSTYQTVIKPGTAVLAATMSAMFDEMEVPDAASFIPGRPAHHYLHFGHGLHQCFGRHVNWLQIPRIAREVLRLPNLRRAEGADGAMTWNGPFPSRLLVEFDK